jgi:hypothetical protein
MSTLQKIKESQLKARKEKDSTASSLLTTIIGEAEMIGKSAGNRETTEEEVIQVLRKFEKNQVENQRIYIDKRLPEAVAIAETEIGIIRQFLPTKLTDLQVQKDIGTLMTNHLLPKEQKSLGIIIKELKTKYGSQFDGQQVSTQFKQILV